MIKKKITVAAFDFDGTLTHSDSLIPFLIFDQGLLRFSLKLARVSPALAAYALGIIRNDKAKEILLKAFFGGRKISEIEHAGNIFAKNNISGMLNKKAYSRFLWHKSEGHTCILVSASLVHYLSPWAKEVGFEHVIGSSFATDEKGIISGALQGGNCYGEQKSKRLREWLGGKEAIIYAYGDSRGDKELLEMADFPYYKTMP